MAVGLDAFAYYLRQSWWGNTPDVAAQDSLEARFLLWEWEQSFHSGSSISLRNLSSQNN
jgi:hypothetical protein